MKTYDRRTFIGRSLRAALGGVALGSAFGQVSALHAAVRAKGSFADYRALVCVFLYGGNDGFNTVVPIDGVARSRYASGRPSLALAVDQLQPLTAVAGGGASDGCAYGLYRAQDSDDPIGTTGLHALFAAQKLAVVANVGALLAPTSKPQYGQPGHALPPQLFSHNDQQNFWQTGGNPNGLGWAGRMADLLHAGNANTATPMCIATAGDATVLRGASVSSYAINPAPRGAEAITFLEGPEDASRRAALLPLIAANAQSHLLERSYAARMRATLSTYGELSGALSNASLQPFPDSSLGRQLDMVARLISVRQMLGMSRQVFFVQAPGYDTHDNQGVDHPLLLAELAQALRAFHDATEALGIADGVTTFTASEFGRTLSSNGDGSDHGWGSHHLVMGGAVRGGRFFGSMPDLASQGPDDAGWGQIIPSTSVDQYAATFGAWLGVDSSTLNDIFPNLQNFPAGALPIFAPM